MKTIGVVICSYKYGHLASHCIESILSQTVMPDKVWFVDDGVGDCKHLPQIYPELNYILRKDNYGVVANFQNMLFSEVDTDYVMFIGADNWLRSDTIEKLKNSFNNDCPDIVTYDIIVTGELKKEIIERGGNQAKLMSTGDIYWDRFGGHHGSMLYNVELAKKVGGYTHSGKEYSEEDRMLWDRLLETKAKVEHIDEAFLFYRRHRENYFKY